LLFAVAFVLLGTLNAFAITRDTVLTRAQTWVDRQVPYSQSKYYAGYRTDCSGFTSMSWNTTVGGHTYSYTTRSLHNVAHQVATSTLLPGDVMLRYDYHVRVFYGWVDDTHTTYVAYEQTSSGANGSRAQINIKNMAADVASGYKPYRYDRIRAGSPVWDLATNPGFDTWVLGSPVWWTPVGGSQTESLLRTVPKSGTARNALRLVNPSSRSKDVVGVSQSATITAGIPYRFSVAATSSAAVALSVTLTFVSSGGATLSSVTTSGVSWGIDPTSTKRMSVTAIAPELAARASYSVRLAGGTDASGSVGATAVVDDVWLNDASPVTSSLTLSKASVLRAHPMTLRGAVTVPIAVGSVRIRVTRPGTTKPYTLRTIVLTGRPWSAKFTPGRRGTYKFTAEYLAYGPFGPAVSAVRSLKVK
jgi:hypothetical protein